MDFGYHITLQRAMLMHISAEENLVKSRNACIDLMNKSVSDLDQRTDKQRFLEVSNQSFNLPKKFEFQAHKGDEVGGSGRQGGPGQGEVWGQGDLKRST